jgi:hypothetical protein
MIDTWILLLDHSLVLDRELPKHSKVFLHLLLVLGDEHLADVRGNGIEGELGAEVVGSLEQVDERQSYDGGQVILVPGGELAGLQRLPS